jgi:hypothetical protein
MPEQDLIFAGVCGAVFGWLAGWFFFRRILRRQMREHFVRLSLARSEIETLEKRLRLMAQEQANASESQPEQSRTHRTANAP